MKLLNTSKILESKYLSFLNQIVFLTKLTAILKREVYIIKKGLGWQSLESLVGWDNNSNIYDIDVRYAWGSEIFKQHLFDHGWSEDTLIHKRLNSELLRQKLIIYLCEPSTNFVDKQRLTQVPENFIVGCYWQNIYHLYLSLPTNHPFILPQSSTQNFDQTTGYATTRSIFLDKPLIFNQSDSKIKTKLYLSSHVKRKKEGGLRTQGLFKHSTNKLPLVSIVTVVLNGEKYIEQTIQSVINQVYENLEYIVIDGGSKDETLNILKKYNNQIDYWVSEPDKGIYDAMNKGLQCLTGDYVNFMNCGDLFYSPESVNKMGFENVNNSKCGINIFFSRRVSGMITVSASRESLPHQSLFMSRKDFECNIFNTKFSYCADAELWTRFNPKTASIETKNIYISLSRFGGVSTSSKYLIPRLLENLVFRKNKLKALIRLIPKIILACILNDNLLEVIYFRFKRNVNS